MAMMVQHSSITIRTLPVASPGILEAQLQGIEARASKSPEGAWVKTEVIGCELREDLWWVICREHIQNETPR